MISLALRIPAYAMTAAETAGVIGLPYWRRYTVVQKWIVAWLITSALADFASFWAGAHLHNSQVPSQFWYPVGAVTSLGALAWVHSAPRWRSIILCVAAVYVIVWAVLLAMAESPWEYSPYSAALFEILVFAVAVSAIVDRVSVARGKLRRDRGFLVAVSFAIFAMSSMLLSLVARAWLPAHADWLAEFWIARNWIVTVSTCVMLATIWPATRMTRLAAA